jgi:hypothetical protein
VTDHALNPAPTVLTVPEIAVEDNTHEFVTGTTLARQARQREDTSAT